jgi:hypothetical protein
MYMPRLVGSGCPALNDVRRTLLRNAAQAGNQSERREQKQQTFETFSAKMLSIQARVVKQFARKMAKQKILGHLGRTHQ